MEWVMIPIYSTMISRSYSGQVVDKQMSDQFCPNAAAIFHSSSATGLIQAQNGLRHNNEAARPVSHVTSETRQNEHEKNLNSPNMIKYAQNIVFDLSYPLVGKSEYLSHCFSGPFVGCRLCGGFARPAPKVFGELRQPRPVLSRVAASAKPACHFRLWDILRL